VKFFLQVCRWLVKTTMKLVAEAFRWTWQEPVAARGPVWTLAAWVFLPCAIYLTALLYQTGKPITLPLFLEGGAWWVMQKFGKPKLPKFPRYRR
jgi:hypothetical protein